LVVIVAVAGNREMHVPSSLNRLSYLPALDGVRAIAVLLVILSHFPYVAGSAVSHAIWTVGQALRTGYVGVDLFFVLSGFLITRILLNELKQTGGISYRDFFIKRVLRIFPIYYLCVAIFVLCFHWNEGLLSSLLSYTFNWYKPFHIEPIALEHTWSLSVEEQFYLIWPPLIAILPHMLRSVTTWLIIPALSIVAALAISVHFESTLAANIIYMSTATRMISLSLGAYLAVAESTGGALKTWQSIAILTAGAAVLLLDNVARGMHLIAAGGFYWSFALLGYATLCCGAVSAVIFSGGKIITTLKRILTLKPLRYIGKISYGLYLYHLFILFLLNIAPYQTEGGTSFWRVSAAAILTFVAAHLSYSYLELPLIRLKGRLTLKVPKMA
jgi:peptidoglycan/LPS O-acetylase OafA/YrhL